MDSGNEIGNQVITCEICIEPTSHPDKKFKNANKCSHSFCNDCMIKYICVKLEENNVGHIKCPAFKCNHELDPFACASLVGPKIFLRWTDVMCETTIAGWDKCYCPYRNCNVLIVNECGKNPKKSKCPSCKRWLCFQCKSVWHAGLKCEESGELRGSNDIAFGRLAEHMGWNRCPQCRHFVERIGGCRIIKCRCGAQFYYMPQFHRDASLLTQRRACLCLCCTVFIYLLLAVILLWTIFW